MVLKLKNSILGNATLKVVCLMLGYAFWNILSQSHITALQCTVPLCFYGTSPSIEINAPETVTVTLNAKRSDLACLDLNTLAIHLNAEKLHTGPNPLILDNTTLFLPPTIKLVNCCPANSVINVKEKLNNLQSAMNNYEEKLIWN